MALLDLVHGQWVHVPRVHVLSRHIAELLPHRASVLDVGCGDGLLCKVISQLRPDVVVEGIDVKVRAQTHIPVSAFDGQSIGARDKSYDVVMFIDVLHHVEKPETLIREAARVSRQFVIIKDHTADGLLAKSTLSFMDWVSNARHGVAVTYEYWTRAQWDAVFRRQCLRIGRWNNRLRLYPRWAKWIFERNLHFIARLDLAANSVQAEEVAEQQESGAKIEGGP